MDTSSRRPKEHDGILSALGAAIDVLTATRDCCSIPPAGVVFGSVIALLTMIRVRFFLFRDDKLCIHTYTGLDGQRTGLRRARVGLRRYLSGP